MYAEGLGRQSLVWVSCLELWSHSGVASGWQSLIIGTNEDGGLDKECVLLHSSLPGHNGKPCLEFLSIFHILYLYFWLQEWYHKHALVSLDQKYFPTLSIPEAVYKIAIPNEGKWRSNSNRKSLQFCQKLSLYHHYDGHSSSALHHHWRNEQIPWFQDHHYPSIQLLLHMPQRGPSFSTPNLYIQWKCGRFSLLRNAYLARIPRYKPGRYVPHNISSQYFPWKCSRSVTFGKFSGATERFNALISGDTLKKRK